MPDPALTDKGYAQAERMAKWLKSHRFLVSLGDNQGAPFKPSSLIVSPMRRAVQTAVFICQELNMHCSVDFRLYEAGGLSTCRGSWGGLTVGSMKDISPWVCAEDKMRSASLGWWFRSKMEGDEEVRARVQSFLDDVEAGGYGELVVVVGHGRLFDFLAAVALWQGRVVWMSSHNASVSRLDWSSGSGWRLIFWNQHAFLEGDLLSY